MGRANNPGLDRRITELGEAMYALAETVDENLRTVLLAMTTEERVTESLQLHATTPLQELAMQRALTLLALEGPVASDLRWAMAMMRLAKDYERVADLTRALLGRVVTLSDTMHEDTVHAMTGVMRAVLRLHAVLLVPARPAFQSVTIDDERIDFRSEAYAIPGARGWVLIDPLPLPRQALADLGEVEAICLTAGCHQRAAWSQRERLRAPVWAPLGASGLDDEPESWFEPGALLPGALRVSASVGPSNPHVLLRWRDEEGCEVLFAGDLVMRGDEGGFRLVPPAHRSDPAGLLASLRAVAEWPIDRIYPAHGAPLLEGAREALGEAAARERP